MPVFDMKCDVCGQEYEFFKVKSTEIAVCPECHNDDPSKQQKQLTAPAGVYCENESRIDPAFHW